MKRDACVSGAVLFPVGGVKSDGKTMKNPKNGDFPENENDERPEFR